MENYNLFLKDPKYTINSGYFYFFLILCIFLLKYNSFTMLCSFQVYSKVIHIEYILFKILFPYRLLQNIEYSSLCYTVDSCWLSILNIAQGQRSLVGCRLWGHTESDTTEAT